MDESKASEAEVMLAAGAAVGDAKRAGFEGKEGVPYSLVPLEYRVESLERYLEKPLRLPTRAIIEDAASFTKYIKEFKKNLRLFADKSKFEVEAVLNFHPNNYEFSWMEQTALLSPKSTDEWLEWESKAGHPFPQSEFLEFLEDNIPYIIKPEAARIMELCNQLHGKRTISYKSGTRLQNGDIQFSYEEETKATREGGQAKIPETFTLGLRPFEYCEPVKVEAKLRYRINAEGQIHFFFKLMQMKEIQQKAFLNMVDKISADAKAPAHWGCIQYPQPPKV